MERGCSKPHLQETASCSCPERDEFIPYALNDFLSDIFKYYSFSKRNKHGARFRTELPVDIAEQYYALYTKRYCRTALPTVTALCVVNQ
jgi:hypothetical protein